MEIFNTKSMVAAAPFVYDCSSPQMVQMMAESSTEFQIFHSDPTSSNVLKKDIEGRKERMDVARLPQNILSAFRL